MSLGFLVVLFLLLLDTLVSDCSGQESGSRSNATRFWKGGSPVPVGRMKRNVGQLGYLVDTFSPYTSKQLINYANWCGPGGDRAHDGSVRDQCDLCCKIHDNCYNQVLNGERETLFGIDRILSSALYNLFGRGGPIAVNLPFASRKCVPYVDVYKFGGFEGGGIPFCRREGGTCAVKACQCDVSFIHCLRNTRGCSISPK